MPAKNESASQVGDIELSDFIEKRISDELQKQGLAQHTKELEDYDSIRRLDPHNIAKLMADKDITTSEEGSSYRVLRDKAIRIEDWIESGVMYGPTPSGNTFKKLNFEDIVHSKDISLLMPTVVANIVVKQSEVQSDILAMYDVLRLPPGQGEIKVPMISAGGGEINMQLGEAQEPNELGADNSSYVTAITGRVGIKAGITKFAMQNSMIDLYRLHIQMCGTALGRLKERLAVENLIKAANFNVAYNNKGLETDSLFGRTNGTDASGARNGTLSSYDLHEIYAHALSKQGNVDTIVIHPLMWRVLANNSIHRDMGASLGRDVWKGPSGNAGRRTPGSGLNQIFDPGYSTKKVGYREITTEATTYAGSISILGQPFRVVLSPYMEVYKLGQGVTINGANVGQKYGGDMIFMDSRDVGLHVISEELFVEQQERIFNLVKETALLERYGFATQNKGAGIFMLKNVVATEGYDLLAAPLTRNVSVTAPTGTEALPGM